MVWRSQFGVREASSSPTVEDGSGRNRRWRGTMEFVKASNCVSLAGGGWTVAGDGRHRVRSEGGWCCRDLKPGSVTVAIGPG
jgi:hypothetical protein